jgi:hypothetical protein
MLAQQQEDNFDARSNAVIDIFLFDPADIAGGSHS